MKTKINWKQVSTVAVGALLVGATFGAIAIPREVPVEVRIPYEVVKTEFVNVTVPTPYEVEVEKIVEKEVFVDNGDMAFVLQRLEDQGVIADAEEIVAELKAEDAALRVALAELELDDLFDMLEEKGIVEDEDEVKIIKIYNDYEDVEVVESDFDDGEYQFNVKFKIEDTETDEKKYVIAVLRYEDSDFELLDVFEE